MSAHYRDVYVVHCSGTWQRLERLTGVHSLQGRLRCTLLWDMVAVRTFNRCPLITGTFTLYIVVGRGSG